MCYFSNLIDTLEYIRQTAQAQLFSGRLKCHPPLADIEGTFKKRIFLPSGKRRATAGCSAFPFCASTYSPLGFDIGACGAFRYGFRPGFQNRLRNGNVTFARDLDV